MKLVVSWPATMMLLTCPTIWCARSGAPVALLRAPTWIGLEACVSEDGARVLRAHAALTQACHAYQVVHDGAWRWHGLRVLGRDLRTLRVGCAAVRGSVLCPCIRMWVRTCMWAGRPRHFRQPTRVRSSPNAFSMPRSSTHSASSRCTAFLISVSAAV